MAQENYEENISVLISGCPSGCTQVIKRHVNWGTVERVPLNPASSTKTPTSLQHQYLGEAANEGLELLTDGNPHNKANHFLYQPKCALRSPIYGAHVNGLHLGGPLSRYAKEFCSEDTAAEFSRWGSKIRFTSKLQPP